MNAQDWLDLMPLVADRGWRVKPDGYIRDREDRCPVCALAYVASDGAIDSYKRAWNAAFELLERPCVASVDAVVHAADGPNDPLRPALMAALGMKP